MQIIESYALDCISGSLLTLVPAAGQKPVGQFKDTLGTVHMVQVILYISHVQVAGVAH